MLDKDGKIYFKIIYWGPAGSGKTTALRTLRKITETQRLDVRPTGNMKEISMVSGATLYFDHGIFQSNQDPRIFYHTYTVAGQSRFELLRKRVLQNADGIIVVIDSNSPRWEDCVDSLKELRNLIGEENLQKIPLVILLNKKDLPNYITIEQVKNLLRQLNLWSESLEKVARNPRIYESIALFEKNLNIYESFFDIVRLVTEQWVSSPL